MFLKFENRSEKVTSPCQETKLLDILFIIFKRNLCGIRSQISSNDLEMATFDSRRLITKCFHDIVRN